MKPGITNESNQREQPERDRPSPRQGDSFSVSSGPPQRDAGERNCRTAGINLGIGCIVYEKAREAGAFKKSAPDAGQGPLKVKYRNSAQEAERHKPIVGLGRLFWEYGLTCMKTDVQFRNPECQQPRPPDRTAPGRLK